MAIELALNLPQFYGPYDDGKMRVLVEEIERLHAALTRDVDDEGVGTVDDFNGRTGSIIPEQADYDAFFLTSAEGDAAYAAIGNVVNSFEGRQGTVVPAVGDYADVAETFTVLETFNADVRFANDSAIDFLNAGGTPLEMLAMGGGLSGSNVVLQLSFDGSDGATTTTDESPSAHSVTLTGNPTSAQLDDAQSVFGGTSLWCPQSWAYAQIASHADFGFGTGDCNVEFRFRTTTTPTVQVKVLYDHRTVLTEVKPTIYYDSNGLSFFQNGSVRIQGGTVSANTWHAVRWSRVSGVSRLYLDGSQVGSDYADTNDYGATATCTIGQAGDALTGGLAGHDGWIEELRVHKGEGLSTGASYTLDVVEFPTPSAGGDAIILGDPAADTIIDGLTTNIQSVSTDIDGTLNVDGAATFQSDLSLLTGTLQASRVIAGDPGTEGTGITVNGSTYEASMKVSDLGGTNIAQSILHRHSTTLPALMIGARSNSDTSAHAIVADNDILMTILAAGWDGTDYALSSEIRFEVDDTPATNAMGGQITFMTSGAGTQIPLERMRVRASGDVEFQNHMLGGSGTLGAPSYSFSADPDTGMYWVGAGTLGWATEGQITMRLNNDGRLILEDPAGTNEMYFHETGSQAQWFATDSNIHLFPQGVNVATLTTSGMSIGTEALSTTTLNIGETSTLRGDAQDSLIQMWGEDTGVIYAGGISVSSNVFLFDGRGANPTTDMQINDMNLDLLAGNIFRVRDSLNTSYVDMVHDTTDFNITTVSTANINVGETGTGVVLPSTTEVSLSSSDHPFQIGPSTGQNIRMDSNEITSANNGVLSALHLNADGGDVQMGFNNGTATLHLHKGNDLAIYGVTDTGIGTFSHDDVDFNSVFTATTDWNISGITAIQAGTVDADFDAITGTSYGGIAEANLLSRIVAESVSGVFDFTNGIGWGSGSLLSDAAQVATLKGGTADHVYVGFYADSAAQTTRSAYMGFGGAGSETFEFAMDGYASGSFSFNKGVAITGALTATSYGGILEANLLSRIATETVSGDYTFSGDLITEAATAHLYLRQTGATVDEGNWMIRGGADRFAIYTASDAAPNSAVDTVMLVERTGTTVDSIAFGGAVTGDSFAATGAVTGSNLNVSDWDTAFGWGDHAGVYLPLAGGTMAGVITGDQNNAGALATSGATTIVRAQGYSTMGSTYSAASTFLANNAYVDNADVVSGQMRYALSHATYGHTIYDQAAGVHTWYGESANVTLDTVITKVQQMQLDASANLAVEGNITGDLVQARTGNTVRAYDSADTNYGYVAHDTAAGIFGATAGNVVLRPSTGLAYVFQSGVDNQFRTYDAAGTAYAYMTHDGTIATFASNTGDIDISPAAATDTIFMNGKIEFDTVNNFDVDPAGMVMALYNASEGYIQIPNATGSVSIWDGASARIANFDDDGTTTLYGQLQLKASEAAEVSLNIPEGVAPTVPVDGDFWVTTTDAFVRVNGVSESIIGGGGGVAATPTPASGEIALWDSTGATIAGDPNFLWSTFLTMTNTNTVTLAPSASTFNVNVGAHTGFRFDGLTEADTEGVVIGDGAFLRFEDTANANDWTVSNTGIGGAGAGLVWGCDVSTGVFEIQDQAFRISNTTTGTDYGQWSHDDTDLNLVMTGTTDYRISGFTGVVNIVGDIRADSEANNTNVFILGPDDETVRGASQLADFRMYSESGSLVYGGRISGQGSVWELGGVGTNQITRLNSVIDIGLGDADALLFGDSDDMSVSWTGSVFRFDPLAVSQVMELRENINLRFYDTTNSTSYTEMDQDTSGFFTIKSSNVGTHAFRLLEWNTIQFQDGAELRVYNSGDGDWMAQSHDGTDYNFDGTNTASVNFSGLTKGIRIENAGASIELAEAAADASGSTAGYGKYWVKNGTPNHPWFTDDSGIETNLHSGVTEVDGKTASYNLVIGDRGKTIRFTGATASKVCTIPANASVAFPVGSMVGIENDGSVNMTVAITTDTLTWSKDNTTGTRTLAPGASCVIKKVASTNWKIAGSALVT